MLAYKDYSDVVKNFPKELTEELSHIIHKDILNKFGFFTKNFSQKTIDFMLTNNILKIKYYLPNEIII